MIKPLLPEDLNFIKAETSECMQCLHGRHILITGASGFIGSWLTEFLVFSVAKNNLELKISILTRDAEKFRGNYPHLIATGLLNILQADIRELTVTLIKDKVDYIIHGATDASAHLNATHPVLMANTIVKGTQNVLDLARKNRVSNVLFLSSGAVYGRQELTSTGWVETDTAAPDCNNPLSSYGEAKRYAELLCAMYNKQYGVPYVTARCFAFIGPRLPLNTHFAIGNFIAHVLNNQNIIINGNGKAKRSYMYASDLVIWLLVILTQAKKGEVYNVGGTQVYSIEQLAQTVLATCAPKLQYKILAQDSHNSIYLPNIDKALVQLAVKVYHGLPQAINKTLAWHRE